MVWYDMTRFAHLMFPLARFCCRLQREPLQRQAKSCSGWSSYVQSVKISVKVMHHRAMLYCCYCYYYYYFYLIICTYIYIHMFIIVIYDFRFLWPCQRLATGTTAGCGASSNGSLATRSCSVWSCFGSSSIPGIPGFVDTTCPQLSWAPGSMRQHAAASAEVEQVAAGCYRLLGYSCEILWIKMAP